MFFDDDVFSMVVEEIDKIIERKFDGLPYDFHDRKDAWALPAADDSDHCVIQFINKHDVVTYAGVLVDEDTNPVLNPDGSFKNLWFNVYCAWEDDDDSE